MSEEHFGQEVAITVKVTKHVQQFEAGATKEKPVGNVEVRPAKKGTIF